MNKGKVYLTGGGCGDAGLLTLRALDVLRSCDTVVYDSLVSEELLQWTKPGCEKIYVGKRYGRHAMKQTQINTLLEEKALEGKTVARLKGGDPYVFGRGGEEFLALKAAGIPCEEIPGISSAIAAPAAAGIPVTHRGISAGITVVTGTAAEEGGNGDGQGEARLCLDFDTLARLSGTLVILMGMHYLREITEGLLAAGKDPETPCAIVMEGTTARQRCMRTVLRRLYAEAQEQGFTSPAVIVVGGVAALELLPEGNRQIAGTENFGEKKSRLPLSGVTVGVTGTPHFAGKLSKVLKGKGAEVWDMSFMKICRTQELLPDFSGFQWLVFTSPNGAGIFLEKMRQERRDLRTLHDKRIAVIGPGTAEVLEAAGIYAAYMPEIYDAAHLAEGLTAIMLREGPEQQVGCPEQSRQEKQAGCPEQPQRNEIKAVFLRAIQGSDELPRVFADKGISFVDHPLYELEVDEEKRAASVIKKPDYIVFGSAMGVRAYFEGLEQSGAEDTGFGSRYVCIGARCAEALRNRTAGDFLVAKEPAVEAVAACICKDKHNREAEG